MSLQSRLYDWVSAVGADYKTVRTAIAGSSVGTLARLTTVDKTSLIAAVNEVTRPPTSFYVDCRLYPAVMDSTGWTFNSVNGYNTQGGSAVIQAVVWCVDVSPVGYQIELMFYGYPNNGICDFEITFDNGVTYYPLAMGLDMYYGGAGQFVNSIITYSCPFSGKAYLRLRSTGTKNPASTGYYFQPMLIQGQQIY